MIGKLRLGLRWLGFNSLTVQSILPSTMVENLNWLFPLSMLDQFGHWVDARSAVAFDHGGRKEDGNRRLDDAFLFDFTTIPMTDSTTTNVDEQHKLSGITKALIAQRGTGDVTLPTMRTRSCRIETIQIVKLHDVFKFNGGLPVMFTQVVVFSSTECCKLSRINVPILFVY